MSTDTVQSPFTMQDASMALLNALHITNTLGAVAEAMDEPLQATPVHGLLNALQLLIDQLEKTLGPAQEAAFNATFSKGGAHG